MAMSGVSEVVKTCGLEEGKLTGCACSLRLLQPAWQRCPRPPNNLALDGRSLSSKGAQKVGIGHRALFTWQWGQAVGTMQSLEVCLCCSSVCSSVPAALCSLQSRSTCLWSLVSLTKHLLDSPELMIYSTLLTLQTKFCPW